VIFDKKLCVVQSKFMQINAVLLDIEGTTAPIDFVCETLFPFAEANIGDYARNNFKQIADEIAQLEIEHRNEENYLEVFDRTSPESVTKYLKFLISVDRKSTPLKSLQGKIWQQGYESNELKSVMFADVPKAFERWKTAKKTIAIYSSGSVLAQKLIFRHSNFGDLTKFISNYFDTNVGGKREVESYRKIADSMKISAKNILFVSDIAQELDAAKSAHFQTSLAIRAGNGEITESHLHKIIGSFEELE
jgi:enolase-phosphatase E1